jgi:hypothetical protein
MRNCSGIADVLSGLALLVADPARSLSRGGVVQDLLPALANAGRALVIIALVSVF